MNKKAQQEMVGFVLIVVVVVVGLMIYLVISLGGGDTGERISVRAENVLDSVMKMTTECAPIFEPDYDNYEELFGSCYANVNCPNLNKGACDYLNESLSKVLEEIMKSEGWINYYKFELFVKNGNGLLEIKQGNCTGTITGAQRQTSKNSQIIIARITLCG